MKREKTKFLRQITLVVICSLFSLSVYGQSVTVTGTVSSSDKSPLPGASIIVKGTQNGVSSDMDGKYSINAKMGDVLEFISIGFATQSIKVDKQIINLSLQETATALDEVVVTALGMTRDKKALGYAMTELKGDDITRVNSANPITSMQGKVAGVQINMGNSGPQSSQRILIRGNTSLGGSNQPIFIVDGIIIDNEVTKTGQGQDFGNDLKNLNADDFESMSILKGAAATALYGSRASNGVVLITTKKGKMNEGIGVSLSHSQTWDVVYKFPDLQNQFGMGVEPAWKLDPVTGEEIRRIDAARNFGPAFDGKSVAIGSGSHEQIYEAKKDNLKQMYKTGHYSNTNLAIQGGDEKGAFRFSYSNLSSTGTTTHNEFDRNNFSLNAQRKISKFLSADAGFTYTKSETQNPTYQGGGGSPIYDFMYSVAREYDTEYWLQNYKSIKGDGWNGSDPFEYSEKLFDRTENKYIQNEENYRGYLNLDFKITDWLSFKAKGDIYRLYTTNESKILATRKTNYDGAKYAINEKKKEKYKITGMLAANKSFNNFSVSSFLALEQDDTRGGYHKTTSVNGLRIPGQFDMTNSVSPATTEVRYNTDRERINSLYGSVNLDYKGQLFLDITGRNDWSSTLIYADGSGNKSYFYPSISSSWIFTETFREKLPKFMSFGKLRASYAVVGSATRPYVTTGTGHYELDGTFVNPYDGKDYPYYKFDSKSLRNNDLKPEKQHSVELGLEMKFFQNRFGIDFAWYKTNTKNQILQLTMSSETGVNDRWVNAGNIQNTGIELLVTATPIRTNDWDWTLTANLTRNRNKIIELIDGVTSYKLKGGGSETEARATVGGSYGDIYTNYAFTRNEQGEKVLNSNGSWRQAGKSTKVGSLQPKFLWGATSTLSYKSITLNTVIDARYGGDIFSGSFNYGRSSGRLESSLPGRTKELGGLERTLADGRIINDGMIPDGIFADNVDRSELKGLSYQEAYNRGLVPAMSAYNYYANQGAWAEGIRETAIMECSWIAVRELSIHWAIPTQWTKKAFVQKASIGFVVRNLGYLYNSLPDNIHPEGLNTIYSSEYYETGGSAYTRNIGFNLNITF